MLRARMFAAVGTALLLMAACQSTGAVGSDAAETRNSGTVTKAVSDRDLAICEAVFRHQFVSNASGARSSAPAYFLSIEGSDPPKGFLNRFKANQPPVRPGSEFETGAGLLFSVDRIKDIDPMTVEVEGGYYEADLSSSGNSYRLELHDPSWVVVSDQMNWIS
jgi:hypothetical protein